MITETQPIADVKPAQITEAEAMAFFISEQTRIQSDLSAVCNRAKLQEPQISIFPNHGEPVCVSAWDSDFNSVRGSGKTIADAVEKFTVAAEESIPDAQKLRDQAAVLLAKASEIEAGKETA